MVPTTAITPVPSSMTARTGPRRSTRCSPARTPAGPCSPASAAVALFPVPAASRGPASAPCPMPAPLAHGRPTERGSSSVAIAASVDVIAVTTSTPLVLNPVTSTAASPGPTTIAIAWPASRSPMSRSSGMPALRAICGESASRAAMPGTSPIAPRMPKSTNQPSSRPRSTSTIGSASSASAETTSAIADAIRRSIRSRSAPPRMPASTDGTAVATASTPAPRALPVAASSSSGRATAAMALPSADRVDEVR